MAICTCKFAMFHHSPCVILDLWKYDDAQRNCKQKKLKSLLTALSRNASIPHWMTLSQMPTCAWRSTIPATSSLCYINVMAHGSEEMRTHETDKFHKSKSTFQYACKFVMFPHSYAFIGLWKCAGSPLRGDVNTQTTQIQKKSPSKNSNSDQVILFKKYQCAWANLGCSDIQTTPSLVYNIGLTQRWRCT